MTKEDIIRSISEEFKISELESISFYENIFRYIESSFRKNRNLNITDFGKFNVIEKPGTTGERTQHVKFSPSKKLATEINYNYSNLAKILFKDIEDSMNRERILKLGDEKPAEMYAKADENTTISSGDEGSGSDDSGEKNISEVDEFLRNYTDQEKRFLQKQVVPANDYSPGDLKDLDARITKVENFIAMIREYFEKEKLGDDAFTSFRTQGTDALLKAQAETYEKNLRKLEDKVKDLETRLKPSDEGHSEAGASERDADTGVVEPPKSEFTTSAPIIKIRPEHTKEVEDKILQPPVTEYGWPEPFAKEPKHSESGDDPEGTPERGVDEVKEVKQPEEKHSEAGASERVVESFTDAEPHKTAPHEERPLADPSTRIASDEQIEKISDKFREAFPEQVKHPVSPDTEDLNKSAEIKGGDFTSSYYEADKKVPPTFEDDKPSGRTVTSDNVSDLLDQIKSPVAPSTSSFDISHREVDAVESEIQRKAEEEKHPEIKKDDDTDEILKKAFTEVHEVKPPEPSERSGEPSVDADKKPTEPEHEDERLSKALSSIYTSILESEKIQSDDTKPKTPVDEKLKNLHDEINKVDAKPEDTYQPPKSFNDIFEESVNKQNEDKGYTNGKNLAEGTNGHNLKETNGHNLKDTNGHNLKDTNGHNLKEGYTNGHNLKDTNGHNLKEGYTNGHNLKDTNGHNLKDTNGHGLKETNGHNLTDTNGHGLKDTNGHNLTDTNGHGLAEGNGKTLKENVSETLKQNGNKMTNALERNGLTTHKDSKLNAIVIVVIIIIAIALLAYGIFSAGIFGKSAANQTLLKVSEPKTEKYYFDNGKDMVFFKTDAGFTIQVGSYKQKEKAVEKKSYFEKNNLDDVRIEEISSNNETFYRVRIGKFESLDQAKNFSETL